LTIENDLDGLARIADYLVREPQASVVQMQGEYRPGLLALPAARILELIQRVRDAEAEATERQEAIQVVEAKWAEYQEATSERIADLEEAARYANARLDDCEHTPPHWGEPNRD